MSIRTKVIREILHRSILAIVILIINVPAMAGDKPKLILQITVDQFRGDLPTRYYDRLGEGGLRYLLDKGTAFAFPSRTLYHTRDTGMDSKKLQSASEQVTDWIDSQSLPFPNFTEEHRKQVKDTLKYPPEGSPDMDNKS